MEAKEQNKFEQYLKYCVAYLPYKPHSRGSFLWMLGNSNQGSTGLIVVALSEMVLDK